MSRAPSSPRGMKRKHEENEGVQHFALPTDSFDGDFHTPESAYTHSTKRLRQSGEGQAIQNLNAVHVNEFASRGPQQGYCPAPFPVVYGSNGAIQEASGVTGTSASFKSPAHSRPASSNGYPQPPYNELQLGGMQMARLEHMRTEIESAQLMLRKGLARSPQNHAQVPFMKGQNPLTSNGQGEILRQFDQNQISSNHGFAHTRPQSQAVPMNGQPQISGTDLEKLQPHNSHDFYPHNTRDIYSQQYQSPLIGGGSNFIYSFHGIHSNASSGYPHPSRKQQIPQGNFQNGFSKDHGVSGWTSERQGPADMSHLRGKHAGACSQPQLQQSSQQPFGMGKTLAGSTRDNPIEIPLSPHALNLGTSSRIFSQNPAHQLSHSVGSASFPNSLQQPGALDHNTKVFPCHPNLGSPFRSPLGPMHVDHGHGLAIYVPDSISDQQVRPKSQPTARHTPSLSHDTADFCGTSTSGWTQMVPAYNFCSTIPVPVDPYPQLTSNIMDSSNPISRHEAASSSVTTSFQQKRSGPQEHGPVSAQIMTNPPAICQKVGPARLPSTRKSSKSGQKKSETAAKKSKPHGSINSTSEFQENSDSGKVDSLFDSPTEAVTSGANDMATRLFASNNDLAYHRAGVHTSVQQSDILEPVDFEAAWPEDLVLTDEQVRTILEVLDMSDPSGAFNWSLDELANV